MKSLVLFSKSPRKRAFAFITLQTADPDLFVDDSACYSDDYSYLKATMGSTFEARHAGM